MLVEFNSGERTATPNRNCKQHPHRWTQVLGSFEDPRGIGGPRWAPINRALEDPGVPLILEESAKNVLLGSSLGSFRVAKGWPGAYRVSRIWAPFGGLNQQGKPKVMPPLSGVPPIRGMVLGALELL